MIGRGARYGHCGLSRHSITGGTHITITLTKTADRHTSLADTTLLTVHSTLPPPPPHPLTHSCSPSRRPPPLGYTRPSPPPPTSIYRRRSTSNGLGRVDYVTCKTAGGVPKSVPILYEVSWSKLRKQSYREGTGTLILTACLVFTK